MAQFITSAALYFKPERTRGVPQSWLKEMTRVLDEAGLPVQEFAITTARSSLSGLFDSRNFRDILTREMRQGNVNILGLYSNPAREHDLVMDWQGLAYIDMTRGDCFLGLPHACKASPGDLLQLAYTLVKSVNDISYGIGYFHERLKGPDFYAVGIIANPDPELFSDPEASAAGDRIAKWMHEIGGSRRYLYGWFRNAYPASLLSEAHVNAPLYGGKTLRTAGLGRLKLLDRGHWLWELSDQEIPEAESLLSSSGLLICQ
jgi:hypothetical protein